MKCNNCGADIRDNTSFCTKCGTRTTGVTLPELESGSKNNQMQTYTPPAPAAPVQKAPEKKKKSFKKPLLITIAAVIALALGVSSFFVIRGSTRSGMPGVFGSVSGSDASESDAQHVPGIIDPATPSSSEKELAIKYVRAVESGKIENVAALYSDKYCESRGVEKLEYVKKIDFFFHDHAGDPLSDFVMLSSADATDEDYDVGIDYKKLRCITIGLNSADTEHIYYLYAVKESDGWFIIYPSHVDFKIADAQ